MKVLVRGSGDVGSAVAHALFTAGHRVAIHDECEPLAARRLMAYSDALFDGWVELEGVGARRCELGELAALFNKSVMPAQAGIQGPHTQAAALDPRLRGGDEGRCGFVPVTSAPLDAVLRAMAWDALVDARMRKRAVPEDQTALAPLVVGLGPNFTAGGNVHVAVETSYEDLGRVIRSGSTLPLRGEPRPIAGIGRERYVYAPVAGRFEGLRDIATPVRAGDPVARIGDTILSAPIDGAVRGLARSGIAVAVGAKVVEIDPRGPEAVTGGIGERPRRIAQGVVRALDEFPLTNKPFPEI